MTIGRIQNSLFNSNTYTIVIDDFHLIIDPGSSFDLENYIEVNQCKSISIILTHGHFDHFIGLKYEKRSSRMLCYCSKRAQSKLFNSRENLSYFMGEPFILHHSWAKAMSVDSALCGGRVVFIETPGHSSCSISVLVENHIFIGDLLTSDLEMVTKLPEGSKELSLLSLRDLSQYCDKNTILYPGHGMPFLAHKAFSKWKIR